MKKVLVIFVVITLFSCGNKPREYFDFEITDTKENIKAAEFKWSWTSKGFKDVEAKFEIDKHTSGGKATAYGLINKGYISDIYTYKNDKPDTTSNSRAWIIKYSGAASKVKVKWSGSFVQKEVEGSSTIETLFQVYRDFEDWPIYANNIRPQIDADTLYIGKDISEKERAELREAARKRMIARYYKTDVKDEKTSISAEGEFEFPVTLDEDGLPIIGKTYRMQLFTRVYNNDGNHNAQYEITDGTLEIEFVYDDE